MNNKVLYFRSGRLLTFSAFRMGSYLRWVLIPGWALIRIKTVLFYRYHHEAPSNQVSPDQFLGIFLAQLVAKMLSSAHQETLPCNLVP